MPVLRAFAFVVAMAASFLVLVPVQALARRGGWRIQNAIQTGFCRAICAIIGVKVTTSGALPGRSPRVVVANHVSWTDVIALARLHPFVFLAKSEVRDWPVLGLLARLQGTVFVDRGARRDVARVNDALLCAMREGRDLVMFAEGTSSDGTRVLPFNSAHFAPFAAPDGEAAIVPAAICYLDGGRAVDVGWYGDMDFLPHLWSLMKRGGVECRIGFGEAMSPNGRDRKALAAQTETKVRALLARIRI